MSVEIKSGGICEAERFARELKRFQSHGRANVSESTKVREQGSGHESSP